jgi:hypothetical protein
MQIPAGGGGPWREVEAIGTGWRRGVGRPDPASLGELMARAGLSTAVVRGPRGELAVWRRTPGRKAARFLGSAASAAEVAALVAGPRSGPGIDPTLPLLRESSEREGAPGSGRGGKRRWQEWWVYAAVIGAVAVGAGIVAAQGLGDDHQRIEITFP